MQTTPRWNCNSLSANALPVRPYSLFLCSTLEQPSPMNGGPHEALSCKHFCGRLYMLPKEECACNPSTSPPIYDLGHTILLPFTFPLDQLRTVGCSLHKLTAAHSASTFPALCSSVIPRLLGALRLPAPQRSIEQSLSSALTAGRSPGSGAGH